MTLFYISVSTLITGGVIYKRGFDVENTIPYGNEMLV